MFLLAFLLQRRPRNAVVKQSRHVLLSTARFCHGIFFVRTSRAKGKREAGSSEP